MIQRSESQSLCNRSWALLLCAALIASGACGDDSTDARSPDPARSGAPEAGPHSDAGKTTDAATSNALRRQSFAAATATLTALADDASDGGPVAIMGQARFRATSEGVDLEIALQSCTGDASYTLAILDAADCTSKSLQAAEWAQGLGRSLPVVDCLGTGVGQAATGHARRSDNPGAWSIGDGSDSDLLDRVFVVRTRREGLPVACGVITRSEDVQRLELPPEDQPPSVASRAAVGGICFQRQYPGSSARCPDDAAVLRCQETHCDIGHCLQTCQAYASCLDRLGTQCSFTSECEASEACRECQDQVHSCSQSFCAEHTWCPAMPTPDGPCQRVAYCCALQGPEASYCLSTLVPLLSGFGGDDSCIGNMIDLGFTPLLHVPCTFGPVESPSEPIMRTTSSDPDTQLADRHAGIACASDADCPGGMCAQASEASANGFCTRACEASFECGREGVCSGAVGAKQCFAACWDQSECREGFRCIGRADGGAIRFPGSCLPERRTDHLEDGIAGRACTDDVQCNGGHCASQNLLGTSYPGNYCTGRCYHDAQCGQGGVCMWTPGLSDPGYCLQRCSSDADCTRDDYGCWELSDGSRPVHACYPRMRPLPDHRTGGACTSDAECGAPNASCAETLPFYGSFYTNETREAPSGYCTQRCALDIECGAGAQCINYGTEGGLCFATCTPEKPCREGYACYPHGRDNDPTASICVVASP